MWFQVSSLTPEGVKSIKLSNCCLAFLSCDVDLDCCCWMEVY